jgi:gamma-glutamyltranspeptidase/glutathione hydrolase
LLKDSLGPRDPFNVHLIVEAERRAYADRALFLGDGDFCPVPVDSLLDKTYLAAKFSDFNSQKATPSQSIYAEKFNLENESFETTHLSIVDGDGNAVSLTTTLNDNYGCKVWVPGGGYFLNNEMDDFSSKPGHPNLFGLVGGEANAIAPGKRMLSSMTPAIIEKNSQLWLVLGTPGGSTIITSVLQVFLNASVFEMDIHQAVSESRFHHQWLPDEIILEKDAFSTELSNQLTAMGHSLRTIEQIGLIEAIQMDSKGIIHGAADKRGSCSRMVITVLHSLPSLVQTCRFYSFLSKLCMQLHFAGSLSVRLE